jgi:hypothetical protein
MYEKRGYNTQWVKVGGNRVILVCGNKSCETCSIRFKCFTSRNIELSLEAFNKMFNVNTNSCFVRWKRRNNDH